MVGAAPPQGKRLNPGNSAAFHVRSEFDVVDGEPAPAAEPYGALGPVAGLALRAVAARHARMLRSPKLQCES